MSILKKLLGPVDMTEGTPWRKIALFTLPMLLGNIAQQLYNTVDSIVVGRYIGDSALAAVGSAGPIVNLLYVLYIGIGMGAGIMVSQYFGARNREELSETIGSCMVLTAISVLFIMIIAFFITRPLLELLNTPETIIDGCNSYLLILFIGSAGLAYYNILSGLLRGLGDSVSALIYLVISTAINIVLDVYFVAGLNLGIAGVAYATVIAQTVSALLCLKRLMQMKNLFEIKLRNLKLSKKHSLNIIRLGLPSGVTQAIFSMAMIIVQSLTNSFGELFIAANVIVMRVDGFAILPDFSFGTALTTYAGQNAGAKLYDRLKKGTRQGTVMALGTSAVITLIILFFGRNLMEIFTETPELVDLSEQMMKILAFGYLALTVTQCLSGAMRGAGDTMTPMWISLLSTVVIRVPLAYALAYLTRTPELPNGRQESVFISLLCSWVLGAFMTFVAYKRGKWLEKALNNAESSSELAYKFEN